MDIDDTLVDDNQHISKHNLETIKSLKNKAIFYVATGRMFTSAKVIANEIDAQIVASNGGIYQIGNSISKNILDSNNLSMIYQIIEKYDLSAFFFSDHQVFYNHNLPGYFKHSTNNRIASPNPDDYIKINREKLLKHHSEIINGIIIEDHDLQKLEPAKIELKNQTNLNISSSFKNNIELIPEGISKATAIKQVQNQLNISPEHTFTFGDGENDIEMFKTSKYSVAMDNASDLVKKQANFTTDTYLNDGVAKFLERHLLQKGVL